MKHSIMAMVLAASAIFAAPAAASDIAGYWRGSGYAHVASGERENVRCQVTYTRASGSRFSVRAVCASPAVRIEQSGTVYRASANVYRGTLRNYEYNLTANVYIVLKGNRQDISVRADEGAGKLVLWRR